MSAERPMLIKYGGHMYRTPPVPVYTVNIARRDYRERRKMYPDYIARGMTLAFLLSSVSDEVRPTAKHKAWQDSLRPAAVSVGEGQ